MKPHGQSLKKLLLYCFFLGNISGFAKTIEPSIAQHGSKVFFVDTNDQLSYVKTAKQLEDLLNQIDLPNSTKPTARVIYVTEEKLPLADGTMSVITWGLDDSGNLIAKAEKGAAVGSNVTGASDKTFKNIIKYVDNYNVTSTGKIAQIIGENGELLGTLYKQKKYQRGTKLEYTYKYKTSNGNIKNTNLTSELDDGFVEFDFNLPQEIKGQGLSTLVFDDAIKYYNIKNSNYLGVRGRWESGNPNYLNGVSDNFKAFKEAKSANFSADQAAFKTWTGKQAQKHGFTKAKVLTDNNNLVIVEFTK